MAPRRLIVATLETEARLIAALFRSGRRGSNPRPSAWESETRRSEHFHPFRLPTGEIASNAGESGSEEFDDFRSLLAVRGGCGQQMGTA
jgi:hypothetical protein